MTENDGLNVPQMLISISTDVASIKTKLDNLASTDEKAEKALAKSIENEHRISQLATVQTWLIGLIITGLMVPIAIYVFEKFL